MKTETSVVVEKYKDSIFSAAFNVCANAADAEDVVQDTFIRYHTTNTQFADEQLSAHGCSVWRSTRRKM